MAAKLQAVFVIPIAVVVVLVQRLPARRVIAAVVVAPVVFVLTLLPAVVVVAPVVFVLTLLPAVAAGASLTSLLASYPSRVLQGGEAWGATRTTGVQMPPTAAGGGRPAALPPWAAGGSARGGVDMADPGFRGGLTYNASSIYQWLPTDAPGWWRGVGLALTGAVLLALGAWAVRHRDALGDEHLALLTTTVLIAVPFLLPSMHDRYAYLTDVATVGVAFVVPRSWPAALLMQVASLVAYASYLWGSSIPLWVGTTAAALALAWSGGLLLTAPLRAGVRTRADDDRHVWERVRRIELP